MKTLRITEMGNNIISFAIFNDANQQIARFRRSKNDKQKHIERIRKIYMRQGESVFCDDQTVNFNQI